MPRMGVSRGPQLGILLLLYQLAGQIGLGNIPPATLGAIALQVAVFLGVVDLGWSNLPVLSICLSGHAILQRQEFRRLIFAPLTHGSDIHLYYNMISLAWKGIRLERRYGTIGFTGLLIFFTISSGIVYVGLAQIASQMLHDPNYFHECAVGFSAVLFALKVVANHHSPSYEADDFGFFSVPKKMAVWAELLLIQMLVPNASFLGHLAGILTGIISLQFLSAFQVARMPFNLVASAPGTTLLSGLLLGLQFDLIPKPWNKARFWSSRTSLVCLSADHVIIDHDWIRLISAPLEHAGDVHFIICFVSIFIKLLQLEQKRNVFKLVSLSAVSVFGTSIVFVVATFLASFLTKDRLFAVECVQGLSGSLFALKVILLTENGVSLWSPWVVFELAEMMILLERRTLLFHGSGLVVGICILILKSGSRFPGAGIILGRTNSPEFEPWTRSWGYGRRPRPAHPVHAAHSRSHEIVEHNDDEQTNSESSQTDERRHSTSTVRATTLRSSGDFPPPPTSGGQFLDGDSQSESSPSPTCPDLEEIRRRRLLRFS